MSFLFRCPLCHAQRIAADQVRGRRVRCPECSQIIEAEASDDWGAADMRRDTQIDVTPAAPAAAQQDRESELSAEPMTDDPDTLSPAAAEPAAAEPAASNDDASVETKAQSAPPPPSPPPPPARGEGDGQSQNKATLSGFTPVSEAVEAQLPDSPSDDGHSSGGEHWWDDGPPGEPDDSFVSFGGEKEETEMDMTPMVDVTFLLLIFFMVTASFSLQKSLEAPKAEQDDPSTNVQTVEEFEDNMEFVVVVVDEYNTYRVVFAGWEQDEEAPSQHELIRLLNRARSGEKKPTRLVIAAHGDAQYDTVMKAWDAGTEVGMEQIQPLLSEEGVY